MTAEEERELLYWLLAQQIFGCGSAQPMHFFQLYGSMAAFFEWLSDRMREQTRAVRIGMKLFYGAMLIFFALVNFAFYKGTQTGVVNETMAFWWELREALRQVIAF